MKPVPELIAAAAACAVASLALLFPLPAEWMSRWQTIADLYVSAWIAVFLATLVATWLVRAAWLLVRGGPGAPVRSAARRAKSERLPPWWAACLLAICTLELATHAGERNGWVATSRPASGVETWTTADGYTALIDGLPAQGDGAALLPMLRLFNGEGPAAQSEFDRRAGHVYLVSLLQRPLGTYWGFATLNLITWWSAALAVWWLGQRRWPGSAVPWIASLLTATGYGFSFVAAAPQAHGPALAAFALLLALCERLAPWSAGTWSREHAARWAKLGWATGGAGLLYLAHIPGLLFMWLYWLSGGERRERVRATAVGLALASVVTLAIVQGWELYGSVLLALRFSGGNNDLVGEALRGWVRLVRGGPQALVGQLHAGSLRGLLGGAFYYPWWVLAVIGWCTSRVDNRRWALAAIAAGLLPAIAFSPRFNLPRVAYFAYPAMYLLAGRGIERLAAWGARILSRWGLTSGASAAPPASAPPRRAALAITALIVLALVALANSDVIGNQQLDLWFHYSQGNAW